MIVNVLMLLNGVKSSMWQFGRRNWRIQSPARLTQPSCGHSSDWYYIPPPLSLHNWGQHEQVTWNDTSRHLSHSSHTPLTLLLHCFYTPLNLLLHFFYTPFALLSLSYHTPFRLLYTPFNSFTPLSHLFSTPYTPFTLLSHFFTPLSHSSHSFHTSFTLLYTPFTLLSLLPSSQSTLLITVDCLMAACCRYWRPLTAPKPSWQSLADN